MQLWGEPQTQMRQKECSVYNMHSKRVVSVDLRTTKNSDVNWKPTTNVTNDCVEFAADVH